MEWWTLEAECPNIQIQWVLLLDRVLLDAQEGTESGRMSLSNLNLLTPHQKPLRTLERGGGERKVAGNHK